MFLSHYSNFDNFLFSATLNFVFFSQIQVNKLLSEFLKYNFSISCHIFFSEDGNQTEVKTDKRKKEQISQNYKML